MQHPEFFGQGRNMSWLLRALTPSWTAASLVLQCLSWDGEEDEYQTASWSTTWFFKVCVCVLTWVCQGVHCFFLGFVHAGLGMAKGTLRGTATRPTLMGLWRSRGFGQKTRELTCVWSAMWQEEKRAKYEWRSKVGVALSHNGVVLFEREPCHWHDLRHFFLPEPTLIVTKPKSMKVIHGTDVRFECGVKADATATVTTTWMKGSRPLTLGWRCILLVYGSDAEKTQRSTAPGSLQLIAFIPFFLCPEFLLMNQIWSSQT